MVTDPSIRDQPLLRQAVVTYFPATPIGLTFQFQVYAYNLVGHVKSSTTTIMLAKEPQTPVVAPVEVTATATYISVSLTALTTEAQRGGATILIYNLQIDDGLGNANFNHVYGFASDTLTTTYTANNVIKGRTYAFRYRARNLYGWSADWSPITYILAADKPIQPAKPELMSASLASLTLRFTPCTDNGGDHIFAYRLYINEGTDGSAFHEPISYVPTDLDLDHTLDTTNEPLIIAGLIYQIKFACENSKGISEVSDILYASTVAMPA